MREPAIVRSPVLRVAAVLCALVAGLSAWSTPASAQRLHVFSSSFGSEGSSAGQFQEPGQLAVNEATGDLYVVDRGNNRIDVFSASGEHLFDFDGNATPAGSFEFIAGVEGSIAIDNSGNSGDPSNGDVYVVDGGSRVVDKFTAKGVYINQVHFPVNPANDEDKPVDVTVDANGNPWIVTGLTISGVSIVTGNNFGSSIFELNDALTNEVLKEVVPSVPERAGEATSGVGNYGMAVSTEDEGLLYLGECPNWVTCGSVSLTNEAKTDAYNFGKFTNGGGLIYDGYMSTTPYLTHEAATGLALDTTTNDLYVDKLTNVSAFEPEVEQPPIETFGSAQLAYSEPGPYGFIRGSEGIAVNSATGTVYVSNAFIGSPAVYIYKAVIVPDVHTGTPSNPGETSVSVSGLVNPDGLPVEACVFEYGPTTAYGQEAPCAANPGSGSAPVAVSANLSGLEGLTSYHYRLRVSNANGANVGHDETFATAKLPVVEEQAASDVSTTSALFSARVNAEDAQTTFAFEYGTSVSYGSSVPAPVGMLEGAVGGVAVSGRPLGLAPGTAYHMRLAARNALGVTYGPDQVFTTQRVEAFALPDGRIWEMVTPPQKFGVNIEPPEDSIVQAATDGSAIAYVGSGPIGPEVKGSAVPEFLSQIISRRGSQGWTTENVALPRPAESGHDRGEYMQFSSDLSYALVEPLSLFFDQLAPEATGPTPYLRSDQGNTYVPLVYPGDVTPPGAQFFGASQDAEEVKVAAATPDLSHVVLESPFALLENEPGGLYEWSNGKLKFVSVLPGGEPYGGGVVGDYSYFARGSGDIRHAVSNDGSKVFWVRYLSAPSPLYMRDTVAEKTVQVDAPATGVPTPPLFHASFNVASPDGSKVFFTEYEPLTANSKVPEGNPGGADDLYVYDSTSGTLTDLSGGGGAGGAEPGDIVGEADVSEDGSVAYFVARAALAKGAQPGELNLYVTDDDGSGWSAPRLIAVLSSIDEKGWGSARSMVNRVSPNGRFLAFLSDRSLTGYDNRDLVSGVPDEEVFLYDNATGRLSCASCNPTGERPVGVFDKEDPGEQRGRLFDDRAEWMVNTWLAAMVPGGTGDFGQISSGGREGAQRNPYQQRYLSDEGRLFFDGFDPLTPQATNGKANVYEFEPEGAGECTRPGGCVALISSGTSSEDSAFMDASESGSDVFFLTSSRLVPQDLDSSMDIYDAHACRSGAPCLSSPVPSPACASGDACKAAPSPQPAIFGAPASVTFSGAGNLTPSVSSALSHAKKRSVTRCVRSKRRKHGRCVHKRKSRASARGSKTSRGGGS